jgi:hypothetical protein
MDLIDQIGGWKSVNSIGNSYGLGHKLEHMEKWIRAAAALRK